MPDRYIFDIIAIIDYDDIMQRGGTPRHEQHHDPQPRSRDQGTAGVRAADHGHSMEAEARRILQTP